MSLTASLQIIAAIAVILTILWSAKYLVEKVLGKPLSIAHGFMAFLSMLTLAGAPFTFFNLPFAGFAVVSFVISLAILLVAVYAWVRNTKLKSVFSIKKLASVRKAFALTSLVAIFLAAVVMLIPAFFDYQDIDESLYLPLATTPLSENLYQTDPGTGTSGFAFQPLYTYNVWELLAGLGSMLFRLDIGTFTHGVVGPLVVLMSVSSYVYLLRSLGVRKGISVGVIAILGFVLFTGGTSFFPSEFLVFRAWLGKTALLHIAIPLLFASLINAAKSKDRVHLVVGFLVAIGAVGLNPTAFYLVPISVFVLSAAFWIAQRKFQPELLLIALPPVLAALSIFSQVRAFTANWESISERHQSLAQYGETLEQYTGLLLLPVVIIVGFFLIAYQNKKTVPVVFFGLFPVLLFATFLNPFFSPLVAEAISTAPGYYRVFWLLPAIPLVGYAAIWVVDYIKRKAKHRRLSTAASALCFTGILVVGGTPIYATNVYGYPFQKSFGQINVRGHSEDILKISKLLKSDKRRVIAAREPAWYLRAYNKSLEIFWSNQQSMKLFLKFPGEDYDQRERMAKTLDGQVVVSPEFARLLNVYRIDTVVTTSDWSRSGTQLLQKEGFTKIYDGEDYDAFVK